MADHPIIFSAAMVKALLDGRKTMTRRLANVERMPTRADRVDAARAGKAGADRRFRPTHWLKVEPGDMLWVRESLYRVGTKGVGYAADGASHGDAEWVWERDSLPSIHMPRGLSRLTLEVTAIKVERLKGISYDDLIDEGAPSLPTPGETRHWFYNLWSELHGPESLRENPAVIALTFKVIRGSIYSVKAA